ncbi:MAG: peptidase S41 [Burkholderiales bacterium]|nr:peptidase S41 [Burkholderiales bacterium]
MQDNKPAMLRASLTVTLFAAVALLSGCGGGGGGGSSAPAPAPTPPPAATLPASNTLAQQCAPTNPLAAAANRTASLDQEKRWLRSYIDEAYLWYREVPTVDAASPAFSNTSNVPASMDAYFKALLTPALTSSGKRKDQFSFTFPTAEWNALSQSGTAAGFGVEWVLGSSTPPRNIRIAYVDPNTPAAANNLARGVTLVSVNGVSADDGTQAGVATLNNALFSPTLNTNYTFVLNNGTGTVTVQMTAQQVTKRPVLVSQVLDAPGGGKVGYIVFNDHITPAEGQLVTAFQQMAQAGVNDLVLDLRYNGGGFLYIASQVGYMIAGATRTSNKVFERLQFNDKRVADNNDSNNRLPFFSATSGFANSGTTANTPLPTLNLARVFVLTGSSSCSASESIINALQGVDVQVIRIGRTTCGKPFGFTAKDNCGISYFPIEFQGVNDKGFGEFADGFTPTCVVADDLSRALGNPAEGMLAAALSYRSTGSCPQAAVATVQSATKPSLDLVLRPPVRENKYR